MSDQPGPQIKGVTPAIHQWNLRVASLDTAFYMMATNMLGPMALVPFLFNRIGIDAFWLGIFSLAGILSALGMPLGNALAGHKARKMPFCAAFGLLHRTPFLLIPIGVMCFYTNPLALLTLIIGVYIVASFLGGAIGSVYQVMLANSTYEHRWGRVMSLRSFSAAVMGLAATALVYQINRWFQVPTNYVVLGWTGAGLLYVSLFFATRVREVPVPPAHDATHAGLVATFRAGARILRDEPYMRWLVAGMSIRAAGFLMGFYMGAFLIERRQLDEAHMWVPIVLMAVPEMFSHLASGRIIDRYGPKAALVLSALLVGVNSIALAHTQSWFAFAVVFASGAFGGSLQGNAWPTFLVKLGPPQSRTLYFATAALACAPGGVLATIVGMYITRATHFDYIFYYASAGGLIAALIFWLKLPSFHPKANARELSA